MFARACPYGAFVGLLLELTVPDVMFVLTAEASVQCADMETVATTIAKMSGVYQRVPVTIVPVQRNILDQYHFKPHFQLS